MRREGRQEGDRISGSRWLLHPPLLPKMRSTTVVTLALLASTCCPSTCGPTIESTGGGTTRHRSHTKRRHLLPPARATIHALSLSLRVPASLSVSLSACPHRPDDIPDLDPRPHRRRVRLYRRHHHPRLIVLHDLAHGAHLRGGSGGSTRERVHRLE